jgi:hypothetical protein
LPTTPEEIKDSVVQAGNMHPLVGNLKTLSDEAITSNIGKLINIIVNSRDLNVTRQAQMILENYELERDQRLQEQLDNKLKKSGKKFKDIIKVQ